LRREPDRSEMRELLERTVFSLVSVPKKTLGAGGADKKEGGSWMGKGSLGEEPCSDDKGKSR